MHRLANALVSMGHDLTCFSSSPCPDDAQYGHLQLVNCFKSKLGQKFFPALSFSRVKKDEFDILHFHGDDYLSRGEKKRVRTFYGSALSEARHARKLSRFLYQSLFYIFELLSGIRQGVKIGISTNTQKNLPFIRTIIPCGVPLYLYKPGREKTNNPSILFIGDLSSRKQGDQLLHIFSNYILAKYPYCTLTVVGPEVCQGPNIKYVGTLTESQLIKKYQQSWIYCMPSSYEGFGVPIIEAMACGTAVVAVASPGAQEIIEHNKNGLISQITDLGKNLEALLDKVEFRKKLISLGKETVRKKYDIIKIALAYEKVYQTIINS